MVNCPAPNLVSPKQEEGVVAVGRQVSQREHAVFFLVEMWQRYSRTKKKKVKITIVF